MSPALAGIGGIAGLSQPFIGNLKFHPLNEKIYGDEPLDMDLVASIERHGLLTPLRMTQKRVVISGSRRLKALQYLAEKHPEKFQQVCAIVFLGSDLEAERILIESNRQRVKTKGQVAREVAELFRIEKALAEQYRLATLKQNQKSGTVVRPQRTSEGKARDIVAEKLGQSNRTVEKEVAIVTAAESGDSKAQEALAKLDRNETSVAAAYRSISPEEKQRRKEQKDANHSCAAELQKLFRRSAEVQAAKHGGFNVFYYALSEEQVRGLAEYRGAA